MEHFLYVFCEQDRDVLLGMDYKLINADDTKNIYVFENRDELHFDINQINAVQSDTLTF